jgi:flagellar assembly protein FliH
MSTSCNPAPQARREPEIQSFPYAEVVPRIKTSGSRESEGTADRAAEVRAAGEIQAQREAAIREAGRQEGEAQHRADGELHLAEIRESAAASLATFARDRAEYFRQVEAEVVQLALSIARKILHREAQIDPLLLAGLARITLEKIESATRVVVRVHAQQVAECRGYFAQHMEAGKVPEVIEDPAVGIDHCILQTALGTTELGVDVQLKEIEQGLFDLLAKRPGSV